MFDKRFCTEIDTENGVKSVFAYTQLVFDAAGAFMERINSV